MKIVVDFLAAGLFLWPVNLVWACPILSEYFADPVLTSDNEGEYVEIRMFQSPEETLWVERPPDSLFVQFEDKAPLGFAYPQGVDRFILVHDTLNCPERMGVKCGGLGSLSLPNSRETVWKVYGGECMDSATVPSPKAGKSYQRIGETGEFALVEGTFGYADPAYESLINDCGLGRVVAEWNDGFWNLKGSLWGCDSSQLFIQAKNLDGLTKVFTDTFSVGETFTLKNIKGESLWLNLTLPPDDSPVNDSLDTLLTLPGRSPLQITEVHHCPAEPEPEWVEIYNSSAFSLPLGKFHFLNRGPFWPNDSILPYQSVLVTRDSASLRDFLGFKDASMIQVNIGYLPNTGGSLLLYFKESPVDSVGWDKNTVQCPLGFNPKTLKGENTPGYQGSRKKTTNEVPLQFKLSSRVVSKRGNPLRVYVESNLDVALKLLDSAGLSLWSQTVPKNSSAWWDVPVQAKAKIGVAYISLSAGAYEKMVGILLRP